MKPCLILIVLCAFCITSCSEHSEELIHQAKSKIANNVGVSYHQRALYPNPVGKVDTIDTEMVLHKNNRSIVDYDFVAKSKNFDNISINNVFKSVDHREKHVQLFSNIETEKIKDYIEDINSIKYSPIQLLNQTDWKFIKDTIIGNNRLSNYYKIIKDEVVEGNQIYTEAHIFINSKSKLLERWERRNFFKGSLSQRVVYKYMDYSFDNDDLAYDFPVNYTSINYGQSKNKHLLNKGEAARFFATKDLHGKSLSLEDYRGKKILLNFSSVGCGNSHEAIKYVDKINLKSNENFEMLYISMWDKKEDVIDYFNKLKTPFHVIPKGKDIEEMYGVSSSPTFLLIDENGIIEQATVGYDKDFLEELRSI